MKTTLKPRIDNDDENFILGMSKEPLGFTVKSQSFNNFSVHLFDEVRDAGHYSKVFDMMVDSGENDLIDFFISSNGGDLDGLNILLEGVKLTDSIVRAIIVGSCHSAASIFALNAHEVIVTDSASMLVHNLRTGFGGKMADLEAFTNFSSKMSNKLITSTYEGFLNPQELQEVLRGHELWLDAGQIRERLQRRADFLETKFEAEQQAALEEQAETQPPKKSSRKKAPPKE